MAKRRIVVDTNILVSAYVFPGSIISELFERIISGEFILGISEEIIAEFKSVLMNKFRLPEKMALEYIDIIKGNSSSVKPDKTISVIKDKQDNRILECAVKFKADYIISGDSHLLKLKKYGKIKIIKASDFAKKYF